MINRRSGIIVGVLGQWASGKTEAAKTLVKYLGGENKVSFLTDRVLFARQVVKHILEMDTTKVTISTEDDGRRKIVGDLATIWLRPGEDLKTVDAGILNFHIYDDRMLYAWRNKAKLELSTQILKRYEEGKPIVVELAFGPNIEPGNPFGRTIADVFERLEKGGVESNKVTWIIIEAGYSIRSMRNAHRIDRIPVDYFAQYGADGGDLTPEYQKRLEKKGTRIKRIANNHDDVDKFGADVITAFEEMI